MAGLLEPFAGTRAEPIAERLIGHFGSLSRALAAPADELATVLPDDTATMHRITSAQRLVEHSAREQFTRRPVRSQDPRFHRYLQIKLAGSAVELLHATFVDARHAFLADEIIAEGSAGHVEGVGRRIVSRALALGARGLILAHNHPSGCPTPSESDIAATDRLGALCNSLDILLIDHLIVAGHEVGSMRRAGAMA